MLVPDNLLIGIHNIFYHFATNAPHEQGEFLQKNRKKLKILVETITEQLVESYFHKKPKNIPTATLLINTHIAALTIPDDIHVFESLRSVLQHYEILSDKSYIDHKPKLVPLFQNEIKLLCLNIALHKTLIKNLNASQLRKLLNGSQ